MRDTLWTLLIVCLLVGLQPVRTIEEHIDILTDTEKVQIQALWFEGTLDKENIRQFYYRFGLAPNRNTAIEHALDKSFSASLDRFWEGVKNVFEIPSLLKEQYKKHGFLKGTWRIVKTVVLTPFRAWYEIFAGDKGLGQNPFVTLCRAALLIIVVLLIADWHFMWFY